MIKAQFNNENFVKGYFPDDMDYPNNVIDTEAKTIDGLPYVEITEEQHQAGLGKVMCVIDGVYQEYVKPDNIILAEGKVARTQETKTKRDIFLNSNIAVSTGEYKATVGAKNLFFNAVNGRTATQYPLEWRLSDDVTWVSLTKEQAYELYDAIEARETLGYQKETGFLNQINQAQTIEELNSILINYGNKLSDS